MKCESVSVSSTFQYLRSTIYEIDNGIDHMMITEICSALISLSTRTSLSSFCWQRLLCARSTNNKSCLFTKQPHTRFGVWIVVRNLSIGSSTVIRLCIMGVPRALSAHRQLAVACPHSRLYSVTVSTGYRVPATGV